MYKDGRQEDAAELEIRRCDVNSEPSWILEKGLFYVYFKVYSQGEYRIIQQFSTSLDYCNHPTS